MYRSRSRSRQTAVRRASLPPSTAAAAAAAAAITPAILNPGEKLFVPPSASVRRSRHHQNHQHYGRTKISASTTTTTTTNTSNTVNTKQKQPDTKVQRAVSNASTSHASTTTERIIRRRRRKGSDGRMDGRAAALVQVLAHHPSTFDNKNKNSNSQ